MLTDKHLFELDFYSTQLLNEIINKIYFIEDWIAFNRKTKKFILRIILKIIIITTQKLNRNLKNYIFYF
jgi:hypothetical protein